MRQTLSLFLLLCLLVGQACADERVTLRLADQKGNMRAQLEAAGALDDLTYDIRWFEFPAAAPLAEALNAGAVDAGIIRRLAIGPAVLQHAHPGLAAAEGRPEILDRSRRHLRVAQAGGGAAEQGAFAKAGQTAQRRAGIEDVGLAVGQQQQLLLGLGLAWVWRALGHGIRSVMKVAADARASVAVPRGRRLC